MLLNMSCRGDTHSMNLDILMANVNIGTRIKSKNNLIYHPSSLVIAAPVEVQKAISKYLSWGLLKFASCYRIMLRGPLSTCTPESNDSSIQFLCACAAGCTFPCVLVFHPVPPQSIHTDPLELLAEKKNPNNQINVIIFLSTYLSTQRTHKTSTHYWKFKFNTNILYFHQIITKIYIKGDFFYNENNQPLE